MPRTREDYRFGKCYPMAFVLAERTGWPVGVLRTDWRFGDRGDWMHHVVHAFVVAPDGMPHDACGPFSFEAMRQRFLTGSGRKIANARFETLGAPERLRDLLAECSGDWWPKDREMLDGGIEIARDDFEAMDIGALLGSEPKSAGVPAP